MRKFVDFVFLTRPTLILPGWGFFILGYMHSLNLLNDIKPVIFIPSGTRFWIAFISATFISAYIYVINQIFDRDSDRRNNKLFLISEGFISVKEASVFAIFLALTSFIMGLFVGKDYMTLLFVGFIVGTLYSIPPFRFKGKPFLDMLSNALGYAFLNLGAGFVVGGNGLKDLLFISLPYFFAVCALYLNTTIPDIPGDKENNLITTGVLLGERITSFISTLFVFLALIFSFRNPFMLVVSAVSLPFYTLAFLMGGKEFYAKLSYRVSGLAFTLLLIIKYPIFAIPSILTLISLRIYYSLRFGLNYPSLFGR